MLNASTARVPRWLNDSDWEWRHTDITEAQQELRRLIAKWNRSGPNLLKLFKKNPDLQASCTEGTTMLIPNTDGVAQLAWFPRAVGHKNASQKDAALSRFIQFLVNSLAPTLGGPLWALWQVLCQEHQTPENKLLAWVRNRQYGSNGHSEEEAGGIFQEAHDRATNDSKMEHKRLSPNDLEEMGNYTRRQRDYTAVADSSSQFRETSCSRRGQAVTVLERVDPLRLRSVVCLITAGCRSAPPAPSSLFFSRILTIVGPLFSVSANARGR
jgi:hypothetical protein